MALEDMLAIKRPQLEHLNSAGTSTTASAPRNGRILPNPKSQLPVELITIILKLRFSDTYRSTDEMQEIYSLKLVSKAWKELIEHTPWFWTYIWLDHPTSVIQDCLQLSRNHFLRIQTFSFRILDGGPKDLDKKLQLLQLHAERWEKLDYNIREGQSLNGQRIRAFLESPAPNLKSLVVRLPGTLRPRPPILNLTGGKANQMKHLSLHNVLLPWSSQLLMGLETLSLRIECTVPVEEIVNIFIKSPRLRSFHLSYRSEGGQDIPPFPSSPVPNTFQVAANSLEEVVICFDAPRLASRILSRVSMPACTSLKVVIKPPFMADIHTLNVAFSQFVPKIGNALSQGGRTRFSSWPEQPFEWSISSQQEIFQFSLESSCLPLNLFIECIRNLAVTSASPLELEIYLNGLTPQWIADGLSGWNEITKLHILGISDYRPDLDDVALFPDYLGQTLVEAGPGLGWPFPNIRELDLSELKCPFLKVFDMLNRRYLPSSDVQRMKELEISVNRPSKMDIRIRGLFEWEDDIVAPAIESHRGVKSVYRLRESES